MPSPSIKSRPVYASLEPRRGTLHIIVADHSGAEAILDLAARAPEGFLDRAHILLISARAASHTVDFLSALNPHILLQSPSIDAAMPRLARTLEAAHMGTQLYLSGTEGLIGQAMKIALDAGMDLGSIQAEHRGSAARRVQCTHCKGISENVRTQPVVCSHCGLTLLVRDHYSRRLAAFQGVCIDAEEPGTAPPPQEIFQ